MNTRIIITIMTIVAFTASSCDYLEPYPRGGYTDENMWDYQAVVQGLIGQCYESMPRNYNSNEGSYLDGATDDAVITSTSHAMRRMAVGTLALGSDPFYTYWERDYSAIFLANTFLKDRKGYNTRFLVDKQLNDVLRKRLQGEAFALRAWFLWDLLQKFGGKGMDGQMLGVPILKEPVSIEEAKGLSRSSYDDCVKQIIADCDSAYKYLPIAYRDFLVPNLTERFYIGAPAWGRLDGITTRAIKANVYLTWASPRFNPNNVVARWDSAAVNAKKVMDFKRTVDNVTNGFNVTTGVNWFNPNFPGIVFTSRYNTTNGANEAMEKMFYPGGFQGDGNMGATQDLVDAFPMNNGYPKEHAQGAALYDPQDPYKNRDPRFYSMIFYNTANAVRVNTTTNMYTFESWEGAKDAPGPIYNSRTGYHIKKFVFMGLNWSDPSPNRQPHSKFFIRWAHVCLIFAEAANHVVGPTDDSKYGLSAKTAISYLRSRRTYDNANGFATDPYLDEVAVNQPSFDASFDAFVKNERRIETCFEGMRFYDLRRWSTTLTDLNKPVRMAKITRNTDETFNYDLNAEVESRIYPSAYLPIPYSEMLRMDNFVQNEGWDNWK